MKDMAVVKLVQCKRKVDESDEDTYLCSDCNKEQSNEYAVLLETDDEDINNILCSDCASLRAGFRVDQRTRPTVFSI